MVSTLFTECQNSTRCGRYDQFNIRGLDFYIENRGVTFGDFPLSLSIKSSILILKAPKFSQGKKTIDGITKKS